MIRINILLEYWCCNIGVANSFTICLIGACLLIHGKPIKNTSGIKKRNKHFGSLKTYFVMQVCGVAELII